MLKWMSIANFALIRQAELDFSSGLTAITGETGSGKSLLFSSLAFACGEPAPSRLQNLDKRATEICLELDLSGHHILRQWLANHDLSDHDDTTCHIRRVLTPSGRSRAYINGHPASLGSLRNFTAMNIAFCAQHAHHRLLNSRNQLHFLDRFSRHPSLIEDVKHACQTYQQARQSIVDIREKRSQLPDDLEEIRQLIAQITPVALPEDQWQQLAQRHRDCLTVVDQQQSGCSLLDLLEDAPTAINAGLSKAQTMAEAMNQNGKSLEEVASLLDQARILTTEAVDSLRAYMEHHLPDPGECEAIEAQFSSIYHWSRRLHVNPENLQSHLKALQDQLSLAEDLDLRHHKLKSTVAKARAIYDEHAHVLSQSRCRAAEMLASQVVEILHELGMPGAKMEIVIEPNALEEPGPEGSDGIEMLFTANPGFPIMPISQIASGGELARLTLAIETVGQGADPIPVLIFDEIDTGVGGHVATMMGKLLQRVGQNRQILCSTHLPQVAAQSDHHFYVEKHLSNTETHTIIRELTSDHERISVLAAMLGSSDASVAHEHASALLLHTHHPASSR